MCSAGPKVDMRNTLSCSDCFSSCSGSIVDISEIRPKCTSDRAADVRVVARGFWVSCRVSESGALGASGAAFWTRGGVDAEEDSFDPI